MNNNEIFIEVSRIDAEELLDGNDISWYEDGKHFILSPSWIHKHKEVKQ